MVAKERFPLGCTQWRAGGKGRARPKTQAFEREPRASVPGPGRVLFDQVCVFADGIRGNRCSQLREMVARSFLTHAFHCWTYAPENENRKVWKLTVVGVSCRTRTGVQKFMPAVEKRRWRSELSGLLGFRRNETGTLCRWLHHVVDRTWGEKIPRPMKIPGPRRKVFGIPRRGQRCDCWRTSALAGKPNSPPMNTEGTLC